MGINNVGIWKDYSVNEDGNRLVFYRSKGDRIFGNIFPLITLANLIGFVVFFARGLRDLWMPMKMWMAMLGLYSVVCCIYLFIRNAKNSKFEIDRQTRLFFKDGELLCPLSSIENIGIGCNSVENQLFYTTRLKEKYFFLQLTDGSKIFLNYVPATSKLATKIGSFLGVPYIE